MLKYLKTGNPVPHRVDTDTDAGVVFDLSTIGYQPGAGVTTSYHPAGTIADLQTQGLFTADNVAGVAFAADVDVEWDPTDEQVKAAGSGSPGSIPLGKVFKSNAETDSEILILLNNRVGSV